MPKAEVLSRDACYTQVCVPNEWSDTELKAFVAGANPIRDSWTKVGERKPCTMIAGHVHVMLEP